MPDLISDYACIETAQQRRRFITKLAKVDLLIIDEWLGNKLSESQINFIFEVIEKRDEQLLTVFSSQFDPKDWYVRLGESTQCESVLNRILSKKVMIDCGSFNMRQYYSKKTPLYQVVLSMISAPVLLHANIQSYRIYHSILQIIQIFNS